MPKYQHDPLAVHPTPPNSDDLWRIQLAKAAAKIAKADDWNTRTGGTYGVDLDCLEVHALHQHLSRLEANT